MRLLARGPGDETLIDYSIYGDNLEILAKWFRRTGQRDKIFLGSKFGIIMDENFQLKGFNSSAEYCKKACNDSLERLGVDYIDLCKSATKAFEIGVGRSIIDSWH